MQSLIKTSKKLSKKDYIFIAILALMSFIIVLLSLAILVLRSTGLKLREDNSGLKGKVSTLQGDLKDIGQRLSGISGEVKENDTSKSAPIKLTKTSLVATPGESKLSFETPEGWTLAMENRIRSGNTVVGAQSEDIDLLTIPNYQVSRVVESFTLKSGRTVFLVFIRSSDDNQGFLSLSFCNPDVGQACSFRGSDGKYVFILAHGFQDGDQFVRDMDFNTAEGIKLLTDFKVMMKSLEIG
jgi:hypothetical protein